MYTHIIAQMIDSCPLSFINYLYISIPIVNISKVASYEDDIQKSSAFGNDNIKDDIRNVDLNKISWTIDCEIRAKT